YDTRSRNLALLGFWVSSAGIESDRESLVWTDSPCWRSHRCGVSQARSAQLQLERKPDVPGKCTRALVLCVAFALRFILNSHGPDHRDDRSVRAARPTI